jgi:hypothetical protein
MLRKADASKSRLGGADKGYEAIRRIAAFKTVAFLWRSPDECCARHEHVSFLGPVAAFHQRRGRMEISAALSPRHF